MSPSPKSTSRPESPEMIIFDYPPGADFLTLAGCSAIYTHPDRPKEVIKVPTPRPVYEAAYEVEKRIYARLGTHPNLVTVTGIDQYDMWMERAALGCLRLFFLEGFTATLEERLTWCHDIAQVLDYVHGKNVRQADLSGRNLLLTAERRILLCDFGGSYIDGEKATVVAKAGYRHPDEDEHNLPTIRSEIHSLGSTIYEIMTGTEPLDGVEDREIDKLLGRGEYPDVQDVPLGEVISKCWKGDFENAAQVAQGISSLAPSLLSKPQ